MKSGKEPLDLRLMIKNAIVLVHTPVDYKEEEK